MFRKNKIFQWGTLSASSSSSFVTTNFPITFSAIPRVFASYNEETRNSDEEPINIDFEINSITTTSFATFNHHSKSWLAIGN